MDLESKILLQALSSGSEPVHIEATSRNLLLWWHFGPLFYFPIFVFVANGALQRFTSYGTRVTLCAISGRMHNSSNTASCVLATSMNTRKVEVGDSSGVSPPSLSEPFLLLGGANIPLTQPLRLLYVCAPLWSSVCPLLPGPTAPGSHYTPRHPLFEATNPAWRRWSGDGRIASPGWVSLGFLSGDGATDARNKK